jgi:hypothetical protein
MDKKQRRRGIGLVIGALLVATLMTVWFSRPELTLIDISHAVGRIDSKKQTWGWLSDEELLVVTADRQPFDSLGPLHAEKDWQGHAELWNAVTGKRTQLLGLTTLLNRGSVSRQGLPWSFKLSPNRTSLVWNNREMLGDTPFPASAHLDGTHYRKWDSGTRGNGFFGDDQHWIEYNVYDNPATVHVLDLEDSRKDRNYPATAPQAKAILALHAVQYPYFVLMQKLDKRRSVEIATYRPADWITFMVPNDDAHDEPIPLSKSTLKFPSGTEILKGKESPDQRTILYHLHGESSHPLLAFLHRILPNVSEARIETESLWMSKIDGHDFREIVHVVIPKDKPKNTRENELSHIEWLPGSKQVTFAYRHTLYVVPVK